LVTTIPKYFYITQEGTKSTTSLTEAEIEAQGLEIARDEDGNLEMDEDNIIKELEQNEGVVLKCLNGQGFGLCLGTQEAYFNTPAGAANVRYCENEVINITFVVSKDDHLCYIYLNGILSGAVELRSNKEVGNQFILSDAFVINSTFCDIDLFRFRIYQYALTMPNVIHNYLSDIHSIKLYD
jgi:hypothetical protein